MSSLVWLEIDARNPEHNLQEIRRVNGFSGLHCAVVKSNAYGHGVQQMLPLLLSADWLGVNSLEEGLEIRALGDCRPVLVMGHVPLGRLMEARESGLRFIVCNVEAIRAMEQAEPSGKDFIVHMKVETGTWRQGVLPEDAPEMAHRLRNTPGVMLEGVYTHFANIEDTLEHRYAQMQLDTFQSVLGALADAGLRPPVVHTACTAAALLFGKTHFDMLRTGVGAYGLWPSRETRLSAESIGKPMPDLRPVLAWKTRIAQVKTAPPGSYIGYGCTFRTTRDTRIAVLPVGYADGYRRGVGNTGWVLVRGRRAPILGRICMNLCMADISDVPEASLEDEVVLLGPSGDENVSAELLAEWMGTINYEAVTGISPLLPRKVVESRCT